jgi:hypothetical protein
MYHETTFINNSGLPINLETWQHVTMATQTINFVLVQPGEKTILPSANGEWYLQTYLNEEMADQWREAGIQPGYRIGKFCNKPCMKGDYAWMEYEDSPFEIIYDTENFTATFIKK